MIDDLSLLERVVAELLTKKLKEWPDYHDLKIDANETTKLKTSDVEIALSVTGFDETPFSPDDHMGTMYSKYGLVFNRTYSHQSIALFITNKEIHNVDLEDGMIQLDFAEEDANKIMYVSHLPHAFVERQSIDSNILVLSHKNILSHTIFVYLENEILPEDSYEVTQEDETTTITFLEADATTYKYSINYFHRPDNPVVYVVHDFEYRTNILDGIDIKFDRIKPGDQYLIKTSAEPTISYRVYGGMMHTSITITAECEVERVRTQLAGRLAQCIRYLRSHLPEYGLAINPPSASLPEGDMWDALQASQNVEITFVVDHQWNRYEPVPVTFFTYNSVYMAIDSWEPATVETVALPPEIFQ